ncbi:MAG: hypothetical protein RLZZ507_4181 [Cyanobacteriota bacterium]|jgi:hypothetical protein
MDKSSLLQQALYEFCSVLLEDNSWIIKIFKHINQMKQEFGNGFLLINVGEFSQDKSTFIFPHREGIVTLWVDESTIHEDFIDSNIATKVLNLFHSEPCPNNHEIFIFIGTIDNGHTVTEGRYSIVAERFSVANPYLTKPSSITAKQIEKRLRRMAQGGVSLLILDTSNPDFMGDNLGKWLREIKKLGKYEDQHFSIIIDSSDEFPAKIPPDLEDDCLTIRTGD